MSKQQKGTSSKSKEANPNILRRALDGVDIRPVGLLNLGLQSWQTALDRSRSIARLAERHNHYSDFSRNLGFSHVVPLSMPRLDMRVVSRYLRLDTAFRPLDRTMRMKRQPEQAQTRPEIPQRFRPTLSNPNDFRRSDDVIERLLEPESPTYYAEPDGYYPEQFEDSYQEAGVGVQWLEDGGQNLTGTSVYPYQDGGVAAESSSFQSQAPALARALERIDTPLSVNNPYAEEVGDGLLAPSFEAATPAPAMVHRMQEQENRSQESGGQPTVRSQNLAIAGQPANLTSYPGGSRTAPTEFSGNRQPTADNPFLSFAPQHSQPPALARAMERIDIPLSVNNPAAQQVLESSTPVFSNFESAAAASPAMVHRTQAQGSSTQQSTISNQNLGVVGQPANLTSQPNPNYQEQGVRGQGSGVEVEISRQPTTDNFFYSALSTQHSQAPAMMRAMERMDTPLSVNNIFAEQPAERLVNSGNNETASPVEMVYRMQEQVSRSQEQGARSQNRGFVDAQSPAYTSNSVQTERPSFNSQVAGETSSSLILLPSSFAPQHSEPPALARALERIDTPITVNNVFAQQPGERSTSPALEAAAAFSPTMVHRMQEQENRSQESEVRSQNTGAMSQWLGDKSQESGARSQNGGAHLTPLTQDAVQPVPTNDGGVQGETSSAFSLQPSSIETQPSVLSPQSFAPPALARALERIDTPLTINNVFAAKPGEHSVSAALEAATAASPAMIHRSHEQENRSKEQGARSQNGGGVQESGVRSQNEETNNPDSALSTFNLALPTQSSVLSTQHSQAPALARAIERLNEQNEAGYSRTESGATQRANPAMPTSSSQLGLEPATPAMVHREQGVGAQGLGDRSQDRNQESGARSQNGGAHLTPLTQNAVQRVPTNDGGVQGETSSAFNLQPSAFETQPSVLSPQSSLARAIQRLEEQIAAEESRTDDGFLISNPPARAAELAAPALLLRKAGDYVPETREENRIRPTEAANPFAAAQPAPQSLADALDMLHLLPSMRETAKQSTGTTVARQVAGDNGATTVGGEAQPSTPSNPILNAVMRSMDSGAAKPLEGGVQSRLSGMFGRNFEHVRVHTDDHAAEATSHMGAEAFTVGQSIFFAPGRYQPETSEGQALIGHELTHVIQNATLPSLGNGRVLEASSDHQHLEREAQQVERTILRHLEPSPYTPIQTNISRSLASTPAPAPMVERSVAPVESVHLRPADSGAIARQAEPGSYIEREIGSYNSIQRDINVGEINRVGDDEANGQGGGKMSDEELAEKVFKLLKERLIIERERHGLRGGSYF